MLMHQHLVQRKKKWNNFMMILKEHYAHSDSKYEIITGAFNAKIGTKTKEEDFKSMGAFGIGERNERADRLIN